MSPEWLTALSSVATLVVIAATAVTAVIQLRHLRNTNQLVVLNEAREQMAAPAFREAIRFIRDELPARAQEVEFRSALLRGTAPEWHAIREVANYFDGVAAQMVKHRMVEPDLACDWWYTPVVLSWDGLAPLIASKRLQLGYALWEDFEYLAMLCKRFRERHPGGTYPSGEPRLPLPPPWPESS